ncbi:hypothetical protein F5Y18DRAFT_439327 [Xylariaceae sp. FL1019]|nr:hypothetical protein F5Y18DRAFT_439327 [Xylariaceae sp. FL1019]
MSTIYTPPIQTVSWSPEATPLSPGEGPIAPLITVFEPRSGCEGLWYYDTSRPGTVWSDRRHDPDFDACQPYGASFWAFSPGGCPKGQEFQTVTKWVNGSENTFYDGFCCSSSFTLWTSESVDTSDGLPIIHTSTFCVSEFQPPVTVWVNPTTIVPTSTILNSKVVACGHPFGVEWHESDLTLFPASVTASLRAAMGSFPFSTDSMSLAVASSADQQPTETGTSGKGSTMYFSGGTIAGLSLGIVAITTVIALLGYLALSRRWKTSDTDDHNQARAPFASRGKPSKISRISWIMRWRKRVPPVVLEMEPGDNAHKSFRGNAWRSELNEDQGPSELHGNQNHQRNLRDNFIIDPTRGLDGYSPANTETPLRGNIQGRESSSPTLVEP